jgi:hypothetical protein
MKNIPNKITIRRVTHTWEAVVDGKAYFISKLEREGCPPRWSVERGGYCRSVMLDEEGRTFKRIISLLQSQLEAA